MTMSKPQDSASSLLDPSHTKSYTQEQVKLLYNGLPLSLISSLIIGLLLSISHLPIIGQAEIIIWNLILGASLIIRLVLWQFWLNAGQLYDPKLWLQFFRIGAWLGGAAWGAAPILIYAHDNSIYQALLSFSLAGVVSGSLTSLSADRLSAVGFALLAVCPLTVQIIINDSPTAFAMSVMTILFIIFVISSSGRTEKELRTQIQQNEALFTLSYELQNNREVDAVVAKVQSQYIADKNHIEAMQTIITHTIQVSNSEMGFIGEVFYDADNKAYLKMLVFDHSAEGEKSNFFHEPAMDRQEFRNLNGLFGSVLQTGKPIFCGNPRRDIRSIGIPEKHPEINNFVGIPVFQGNQLVAVLCLANSSKEYTTDTIELLTPISNLIAQFIHIFRLQKQHKQDIAVLEETTIQTQTILDDIADGIVTINQYGIIKSFNKAAETIFGYKAVQIIGESVDTLIPESTRDDHAHKLSEYIKTGKANIIGIGREVTGLRRNGKHFPLDLMVSRIYRNGEPMFIGIIRDISEKKSLQESHKNLLNNLAKDLRIPSHAISLSLNLIEKNIYSQKHNTSKNLINSAKIQNQHLQNKIQSILNENFNQISNNTTISIKAASIIETCINNYRHIAELRGSRFSLVNRIYDEHMLINDSIFENSMIFFLGISAENALPFSEIKIYLEQYRGRIRIYSIKKLEQIDHKLNSTLEWENCQKMLQQIHATLGIEKADKENSTSESEIIYMEFPLAMIKAGL
jgi:two-component system, LuxR family, sensor kinase FixL